MSLVQENEFEKDRKSVEKFVEDQRSQSATSDISESMGLGNQLADIEQGVRSSKKLEVKEHQKIMMQFDKIAT